MVSMVGGDGRLPETALLWDLDNVTPGWRHTSAFATVLAQLVEQSSPKVAAARRSTARLLAPRLTEHGFETLSGGRSRSGADHQLLARARGMSRVGIQRFLVASNDGDLSAVAKWGELHVVTLDRAQVSLKLQRRATSVVVLAPHVG
ncbi:hypothetical protein J2X46_001764 [Nocardioides sp. BE266]|uniref:hypothetical protein n=1 Tax=Nocardioides sp. BE266 TaxID=2817725 RepID=UPI00286311F7|nr:hypothetical protein [Nocardioides sp. BE266]MDR7252779.1 hypothetical protein [Nocardioides sp. BE266]